MTTSKLPLRRLGRTGLQVSAVALGGAWLGRGDDDYTDEHASVTVHAALKAGVNLIDTSPLYGESERRIGLALESWYGQGGEREDFHICTKTGTRSRPHDYSADGTKRSVEESLKLLKTDYLDIVLIHDPEALDLALAPGGALEALQGLKEQGVVRHIGLGVREHRLHREFHETGACEVSLTYRDYNLLDQSAAEGVLATAGKFDVGILNAQAIRHGLLAGRDPAELERELRDKPGFRPGEHAHLGEGELNRARALWLWAKAREIDFLALAVQWCLRNERVSTIVMGASHPPEIESDAAAAAAPIPEEIWGDLDAELGL